uniref:Uncharacterized protein n=1 Tax=Rhizophora mucronata TaxID=61149 RepID=A0A2P2L1P2_RHIMU
MCHVSVYCVTNYFENILISHLKRACFLFEMF